MGTDCGCGGGAGAGITGADGEWKPDAETWLIAENVEHLVLAEASGVNRMWRAVEGLKQGEPPPEATNRGLSIEAIIERTWKPRELAPTMAAPPFGGPLDYWVVALWAGQAVLAALGRELETVVFPPFGRGFSRYGGLPIRSFSLHPGGVQLGEKVGEAQDSAKMQANGPARTHLVASRHGNLCRTGERWARARGRWRVVNVDSTPSGFSF